MNLETPSQENLNFMLTEITTKLKMVNVGVFENLELDSVDYNALIDIYQLIKRKSTFSRVKCNYLQKNYAGFENKTNSSHFLVVFCLEILGPKIH